MANLLKYAFNMNLTAPDVRVLTPATGTAGLPGFTIPSAGTFRCEFIRRINSGVIYTPKKSSTLGAASWSAFVSTPTITPIDATWERVVYLESFTAGTTPQLFGSVEVLLP